MPFWSRFFNSKNTNENACVACGGDSLTILAEKTYQCNQCGYEGGEGYASYRQNKVEGALAQLSDAELYNRLCHQYESCRLSLVAVLEDDEPFSSEGLVSQLLTPSSREVEQELAAQRRRERERNLLEARNNGLRVQSLLRAWSRRMSAPDVLDDLLALSEKLVVDPRFGSTQASRATRAIKKSLKLLG